MGERTERLPPGRHGLSRDYVTDHQRARVLGAVSEVVAEHGFPGLTVERVTTTARVSRKTFYQYFRNKEEAFLAAYDDVERRLTDRLGRVPDHAGDLVRRVETALATVLRFLAENPAEAHLAVVEVLAAGPEALRRRHESVRAVVALVDRDLCALAESHGARRPPSITAETVVGGVVEVLYSRIVRGETDGLPELLGDLVYCALLPYLGPAAAAAEHDRLTAPGEPAHHAGA
ncbi:TetR/AcrR family transcriptional regulator [Saccharomonospora saliphila]|uniref:TetR/AcrR family transcriptional regulator n=1 Tax=Saccharomonospora saliphila TaxID=369829 RepID=UPI000378C07F|nr:TetR/AcrR family transcriptional regulator [Saccharomonospora saliphila]